MVVCRGRGREPDARLLQLLGYVAQLLFRVRVSFAPPRGGNGADCSSHPFRCWWCCCCVFVMANRSRKKASGKAVVDLTENNFKEMVLDSDEMWLVEFFAPWCGHCKKLEPEWESAAGQLSGSVNVSIPLTVKRVQHSRVILRITKRMQ